MFIKRQENLSKKLVLSLNARSGFTLVELMTVLILLSLLAIFVAPELTGWRDKRRLRGAAQHVYADIQSGKMMAIKDNVDCVFIYNGTGGCDNGKYVFSNGVSPDIDECVGDEFDNIQVVSNIAANDGFTPRGVSIVSVTTPGAGGGKITIESLQLQNPTDPTYEIDVSPQGGVQFNKVLKP